MEGTGTRWLVTLCLLTAAQCIPSRVTSQSETDSEDSRRVLGSSVVTSVSVIMDHGNGTKTYFADGQSKNVHKPTDTIIGSPGNLLSPDRYEFYTFDETGDLVKRLMTLDEIHGLIAGADPESVMADSSPTYYHDALSSHSSEALMHLPASDLESLDAPAVHKVLESVQNVLKNEMAANSGKPVPPMPSTSLHRPDSASAWSALFPGLIETPDDVAHLSGYLLPSKTTESTDPPLTKKPLIPTKIPLTTVQPPLTTARLPVSSIKTQYSTTTEKVRSTPKYSTTTAKPETTTTKFTQIQSTTLKPSTTKKPFKPIQTFDKQKPSLQKPTLTLHPTTAKPPPAVADSLDINKEMSASISDMLSQVTDSQSSNHKPLQANTLVEKDNTADYVPEESSPELSYYSPMAMSLSSIGALKPVTEALTLAKKPLITNSYKSTSTETPFSQKTTVTATRFGPTKSNATRPRPPMNVTTASYTTKPPSLSKYNGTTTASTTRNNYQYPPSNMSTKYMQKITQTTQAYPNKLIDSFVKVVNKTISNATLSVKKPPETFWNSTAEETKNKFVNKEPNKGFQTKVTSVRPNGINRTNVTLSNRVQESKPTATPSFGYGSSTTTVRSHAADSDKFVSVKVEEWPASQHPMFSPTTTPYVQSTEKSFFTSSNQPLNPITDANAIRELISSLMVKSTTASSAPTSTASPTTVSAVQTLTAAVSTTSPTPVKPITGIPASMISSTTEVPSTSTQPSTTTSTTTYSTTTTTTTSTTAAPTTTAETTTTTAATTIGTAAVKTAVEEAEAAAAATTTLTSTSTTVNVTEAITIADQTAESTTAAEAAVSTTAAEAAVSTTAAQTAASTTASQTPTSTTASQTPTSTTTSQTAASIAAVKIAANTIAAQTTDRTTAGQTVANITTAQAATSTTAAQTATRTTAAQTATSTTAAQTAASTTAAQTAASTTAAQTATSTTAAQTAASATAAQTATSTTAAQTSASTSAAQTAASTSAGQAAAGFPVDMTAVASSTAAMTAVKTTTATSSSVTSTTPESETQYVPVTHFLPELQVKDRLESESNSSVPSMDLILKDGISAVANMLQNAQASTIVNTEYQETDDGPYEKVTLGESKQSSTEQARKQATVKSDFDETTTQEQPYGEFTTESMTRDPMLPRDTVATESVTANDTEEISRTSEPGLEMLTVFNVSSAGGPAQAAKLSDDVLPADTQMYFDTTTPFENHNRNTVTTADPPTEEPTTTFSPPPVTSATTPTTTTAAATTTTTTTTTAAATAEVRNATTPAANHVAGDVNSAVPTMSSTTYSPAVKSPGPSSNAYRPLANSASPSTVELHPAPHESMGLEASVAFLGDDVRRFADLCNELSFKMWTAVTGKGQIGSRSLVLSPFELTAMLAMVFLGARGPTSGQMNDVLRLDDMVTFNPHQVLRNITHSITNVNNPGVATASFVREIYSNKGNGKILDFYKERVQQYYDGHVEEVDFNTIGDVLRRRTNLLVKRQTLGRVVEYLRGSGLSLTPPFAAFSANVFQTSCESASTEGRDGEMYFVVRPSTRQRRLVPVPAAVWRGGFLAGYEPGLDATAVCLSPDSAVSTILVLPGQQGQVAPGDGLARLEQRLIETSYRRGGWSRILRSLLPRPGLELQVPRFSHRSVLNTTAALQKMGLKDVFNEQKADLRGVNGLYDLYLSDMLQVNTFSTCGEDVIGARHHVETYPASPQRMGRVEMLADRRRRRRKRHADLPLYSPYSHLPLNLRPRQARLPDVPRLRFDRPFLYLVRHNPTGMIVYLGRFNPRLLP